MSTRRREMLAALESSRSGQNPRTQSQQISHSTRGEQGRGSAGGSSSQRQTGTIITRSQPQRGSRSQALQNGSRGGTKRPQLFNQESSESEDKSDKSSSEPESSKTREVPKGRRSGNAPVKVGKVAGINTSRGGRGGQAGLSRRGNKARSSNGSRHMAGFMNDAEESSESNDNSDESSSEPESSKTPAFLKGRGSGSGHVRVGKVAAVNTSRRSRGGPAGPRGGNKTRLSNGSRSMAGFIDDEEDSEDDSSGDDADVNTKKQKRLQKGNRSTRPNAAKSLFELPGKNGICQSKSSLIENTVFYFVLKQHKILPFSRAEICRDAMNGQHKVFDKIIKKAGKILLRVFSLKLVGFEKSSAKTKDQFHSYILVNRVSDAVLRDPSEELAGEQLKVEHVLNFLYVILTCIFMKGSALDEDGVWEILSELGFHTELCSEREKLGKFLKMEYVSKQYLLCNELAGDQKNVKETGQQSTYEWGLRALNEFSKMKILKTTAKQLKKPDVNFFPHAYEEAKKQMLDYGALELDDSIGSDDDDDGNNSNDEDGSADNSAEQLADLDLEFESPGTSIPAPNKSRGPRQQREEQPQPPSRNSSRRWTQDQIKNSRQETQPMDFFDEDESEN